MLHLIYHSQTPSMSNNLSGWSLKPLGVFFESFAFSRANRLEIPELWGSYSPHSMAYHPAAVLASTDPTRFARSFGLKKTARALKSASRGPEAQTKCINLLSWFNKNTHPLVPLRKGPPADEQLCESAGGVPVQFDWSVRGPRAIQSYVSAWRGTRTLRSCRSDCSAYRSPTFRTAPSCSARRVNQIDQIAKSKCPRNVHAMSMQCPHVHLLSIWFQVVRLV